MTTTKLRGSTLANVTSALALVVALGGTGAYAAGLSKDSVKSRHLKDSAVRSVDLANGAVTGAKVVDGSLTGADIDESTLVLKRHDPDPVVIPPSASVHRSPEVSGTLSDFSTKITEVQVDVPADGFVDATATAMLNGSAGSDVIDVFVTLVGAEVARGYWEAGDADGMSDMAQSAQGVIPVTAGTHTFKLFIAEYSTDGSHSLYEEAQLILRYFPEGQVG